MRRNWTRVMVTPEGSTPHERWLNLSQACWVDRLTRDRLGEHGQTVTVAFARVAYPVPAGLVCGLTTVDVQPGPDSQKVFTIVETLSSPEPVMSDRVGYEFGR